MHIKRFKGSDVKETMGMVKNEFGDDALILSTRKIRGGVVEIVAAVDYDLEGTAKVDIKGRSDEAVLEEGASLERELAELREFLWMVLAQGRGAFGEVFLKLEQEMIKNGIDKRLAKKILIHTFRTISKDKAMDMAYLKSFVKKRLISNIEVKDPLKDRAVISFVGPVGSGKTTTIAKLAALHAIRGKRRIALITMDTYRIGAPEQLRIYGRIMGVPVEVASTPRDVSRVIDRHRDKELILIDTPGWSRQNTSYMKELKNLAMMNDAIRFNLVLGSDTKDEALYECVRGFKGLPVDSLTFTKLDESKVYGSIVNVTLIARKPIAYFTDGQRVPEDIECASKEKLSVIFMPS